MSIELASELSVEQASKVSVDLASEVSVELESEVSVELERNARPKRRVGVRGDPFRCLGRCIDVRNHKLGCGLC